VGKTRTDRIALRRISQNITFTDSEAVAWFVLPEQRWPFRSDSEREEMCSDFTTRIATLAGRRLHLRVTSRPFPVARWAQGMDARTPAPLGGRDGELWRHHLVTMQERVRDATTPQKVLYLGVSLGKQSALTGVMGAVLRRPTGAEADALAKDAAEVAGLVAGPGLNGRPASTSEVEYLLRRSMALGHKAPTALSPVGDDPWDESDLEELTAATRFEAGAFASAVKVVRDGDYGPSERFVTVLTLGKVDAIQVPDHEHSPWMAMAEQARFPVEWSVHLDVLSGERARKHIEKKLLVIRDMQGHHAAHGLDAPLALERQASQARTVEDQMAQGSDLTSPRVHGWFRVAVSGATAEQANDRAKALIEMYRNRRMTLVPARGLGDGTGQLAALREFIPGEPLASRAYLRRLPALYFAGGFPAASARLGDGAGSHIGHTVPGARAVMYDPHYATEVQERSGLVPVVGEPGAGKSVLTGLLAYQAVIRGTRTVVLDPSGPLKALTELPELMGVARHIELTSQALPGTLNPYSVVPEPRAEDFASTVDYEEARVLAAQDRRILTLDVLRMLLPPALADRPSTEMLLAAAIRRTKGAPMTPLWTVIEELRTADHDPEDARDARNIAEYLEDAAKMPLAALFFPQGTPASEDAVTSNLLTVLTMPGLVLPSPGVDRKHWSSQERFAVPLLHLAAWYTSRAIYGRKRGPRKVVALDETHFLSDWGAGRSLFTRLARDSRKWNACVLAASQNPEDVLGMEVSNFVSTSFVGRIEDEKTAQDALRMLRLPIGQGYESVLARLSPRNADGRSPVREFVMRDSFGNIDRFRVDVAQHEGLLEALDTTAVGAGREVAA